MDRNRIRWPRKTILLLVLAAAGGCSRPLATLMVSAPNRINPYVTDSNPIPPIESIAGVDQQFRVAVGPPDASLSVSVIEPKTDAAQPKGTILVVHGIYARSLWMMGPARALAEAGYRTVLVDLRGHGRSTGDFLTFGVQEAKDLSQVIDALENRGLVAGRIGVYGISYGATASIHLSGLDPRVRVVVAVAPFSTMRDEVPQFARTMIPGLGWVIPPATYQRAIDEAGRLGRFDPDGASAVEAIGRTGADVLLIHGTSDWIVPHRHSARLHAAAGDRSRLVSVPWFGHVVIWVDPTSRVARLTRDWFDRRLSPAAGEAPGESPQWVIRPPVNHRGLNRPTLHEPAIHPQPGLQVVELPGVVVAG